MSWWTPISPSHNALVNEYSLPRYFIALAVRPNCAERVSTMKKDLSREPDLQFLQGARAYFDTNVFIYHVEAYSQWKRVMDELWQMLEGGWITAVTSELSLAESLV